MDIKTVHCPQGVFLKNHCLSTGIRMSTLCGGRGNCGKCVVRIVEGNVIAGDMDKIWLTKEQIEQGYRLGCHVFAKEPIVAEVPVKDPA